MPWHYHDPFFQETPMVYDLDLDVYYKDKDVKTLAQQFYAGLGLPVEAILAHSDLYEKEGKNPHAFCTAYRPRGRRARPVQSPEQRVLDGDDPARAGPRRV